MDWPAFTGPELVQWQSIFKRPETLEAAFDDIAGARSLVETLHQGISQEGRDLRADLLVKWQKGAQSATKRARRETLAGLWETLPTSSAKPCVADRFEQIVHQNPLALLSGLERRKKASRSDVDNTQRATMERQDREKYAVLLAGFIREADLPVVKHLSGVMDADVWLKVFGRRRSRTLRNRYKDWTNFRRWLEVTHGRTWPAGIADLIDYSKGCGKTVLDAFQASLAVLEQVGRVSEPDMLSRDPTWISYLAATTADLKAAAPPARQAPMITVATIVALELYVISSDEPAYLRGIAWIALLMVYCSLRTDDVQYLTCWGGMAGGRFHALERMGYRAGLYGSAQGRRLVRSDKSLYQGRRAWGICEGGVQAALHP